MSGLRPARAHTPQRHSRMRENRYGVFAVCRYQVALACRGTLSAGTPNPHPIWRVPALVINLVASYEPLVSYTPYYECMCVCSVIRGGVSWMLE